MKNQINCTFLVMCVLIATARAQSVPDQFDIDLSRRPVRATLNELSKQTGLQILLPGDRDVEDLIIGPLRGKYSVDAALMKLLSESGLTYKKVNDVTIAITASKPKTTATDSLTQQQIWKAFQPVTWETSTSSAAVPIDSTVVYRGSDNSPASHQARNHTADDVEEVVVTGTYIRGVVPAGSPIKVYSRDKIKQSGAATLGQFARQMTENFSNVDSVSNPSSNVRFSSLGNQEAAANRFSGSSFNLHGVGAAATLTLLNGVRLAPGGLDGSMTDISHIPLSAVERIEVMTDGSSAVYGADAIAGVVNIITRKDFSGAETGVRYGGAESGGATELTASQLLGTAWPSGNVFLGYEYGKADRLDAAQRDYIPDQRGDYSLIPENKRNSLLLDARQQLGELTTASMTATHSDRDFWSENSNAGSIVSQRVVGSGASKQSSATLAVDRSIAASWSVQVAGSYARQQERGAATTTVTTPAGRSAVLSEEFADSRVFGGDILLQGGVFQLSAGTVKAAVGGGYREEEFSNLQRTILGGSSSSRGVPNLQRHVKSIFAEIFVPLVGRANQMSWVRRLEFSAAGRIDDYSDFDSSANPKVGLVWEPFDGISLRSSYGTSFKPPLLSRLGGTQTFNTTFVADSINLNGFSNTLLLQGGNSLLGAEESESVTAGFDLKLAAAPNLAISATYYRISFTDRIATPPTSAGALALTDPLLVPFLRRNPTLGEVEQYFADARFADDGSGLGASGVEVILDRRYSNITATKQSGVDLTSSYAMPAFRGSMDFSVSVGRVLNNDIQTVSTAPPVSLLNILGQPMKWRANARLGWTRNRFGISVAMNHINSYQNTLTTPIEPIDSWTTGDIYMSYETADRTGWDILGNLTIALSVNNVTDEEPPFLRIPSTRLLPGQNPIPYDPANASPIGRFASLFVTKRW